MGIGYSLATVLGNFGSFKLALLIPYVIVFGCFVIYYIAAIIRGFREKHCGMPWQTNMWNMSNDFCFVFLGFSSWWGATSPANHWFTHVIWIGMVAWFIAEGICHYQAIRWDLAEIFPRVQKRTNAILFYALAQVGFVAAYYWLWSAIDDPLVQIMIATTIAGCSVFVPRFLSTRGNIKGVSAWSLWAVLVANFSWWFFAMPAMDAALGNVYTYFVGICAVGAGIASLVLYYHLKRKPAVE